MIIVYVFVLFLVYTIHTVSGISRPTANKYKPLSLSSNTDHRSTNDYDSSRPNESPLLTTGYEIDKNGKCRIAYGWERN